jgi:hypothetical protein
MVRLCVLTDALTISEAGEAKVSVTFSGNLDLPPPENDVKGPAKLIKTTPGKHVLISPNDTMRLLS